MEEKIYNYLITNNIGKENLIKNAELRKLFNIKSDKSLRKIIQNIREDKNYYLVIGSMSGKTGNKTLYAYWTPNTNTAYKVEHYVMGTNGSYPTTAKKVIKYRQKLRKRRDASADIVQMCFS